MKNLLLSIFVFAISSLTMNLFGQSIEDLKAKKSELAAQAAEVQSTANALNSEITSLQEKINVMSGWLTGISANVGFDLSKLNDWAAAAHPNSSSTNLGIGITMFANKMTEKTIFRYKGIINQAWQKVNLDGENDDTNFFDNSTADIMNLSSLYGYRMNSKLSISALGELNTSVFNFLAPGTFDIGVGSTWTPSNNLVVVAHPLNYQIAWPADNSGASSTGSMGAKIRADYSKTYTISGKNFGVSSTLTTFLPYSNDKVLVIQDDVEYEAGLFNYTWLNTITIELFKGIGVGIGFGLRGSDIEVYETTQSYYNLGLSYSITR
jgi:FtsZ-binding cell division protein ZapB